jgi:hypothetical protein
MSAPPTCILGLPVYCLPAVCNPMLVFVNACSSILAWVTLCLTPGVIYEPFVAWEISCTLIGKHVCRRSRARASAISIYALQPLASQLG